MIEIDVNFEGGKDGVEMPDIPMLIEYVTEELFTRIVRRTPVDTGKAADGWQIDGTSITNDVEYIQYLENGHSDQAPIGMIRISLEEVPQIIEKFVKQNSN